jgi:hypothetical protein
MANYIYGAVALNGGVTGSLDSIDGTDLAQGDAAIVFTSDATYIYTLDESSGGTESSPDLISPDANEENKRWILVSSRAAESALDVTTFNGILDANDDDVQKALITIDDMFDSGDFTIAPGSVTLVDTVVKVITTDNGTVGVVGHSLAINGTGKVNTTGSGSAVSIAVDDLKVVTKTAAYSITTADDIVIGDCSGGDIELTLPQAATKSSISIFKKSSSNTLTVSCYGSETIEANTSYTIDDEYGCLRLISDGVNTWVRSAEMYDLPTASSSLLGGVKIGDSLKIAAGIVDVDYSAVDVDIIPDVDITRSLGSASKQWKDVFVGPGSLYVNGQQVLSDESGTIVCSADPDQNLQFKTLGSGELQLLPAGTGSIQMKGNFSILAGKNIMSSDGNAINYSDGIDMNGNSITGLPLPSAGGDVATRDYVNTYSSNASNLSTGTIPTSVLPPIAITTTQTAVSEIAMLALVTQEGDVVVRTDESRSYIRNAGVSGTMSDFNELATPTDSVLSVNGETGAVTINQDEVLDGSTYVRTANDFTDILKIKLDGVEAGADVNMTPAELLTAIKTVDGPGSGLNADQLDNMDSANAATGNTIVARDSNGDATFRYMNCNAINTSIAQSANNAHTIFYSSTDAFIRKNTAAGFKASLDLDQVENLPASTGSVGNNLVLRDASGNFAANIITATVTTARYADLAEKHTCANKTLITGTVICACTQGEYEVEECSDEKASNVVGVVSEKAGYIMNEGLEDSIIVGLTGKVPVRIIGEVKKGEPIVSAGNGCARQAITEMELLYKMGVALEDNSDINEKLVYCAIK